MSIPESTTSRWLFALKPASWPKLLVPAGVGLALGARDAGHWSILGIAFGLAFVVLDAGYIVLLNDVADREVDALKRKSFPSSGSPKTIPDGVLSARAVLRGGLVCGGGVGLVGLVAAAALGRPTILIGAIVCLASFWAYSLPPLRLNYRGGGEWLEGFGVGAALIWTETQFQTAAPWFAELWLLVGFVPLALASAVASGLSDEVSDRRGGKRTFTTVFGNRWARRATEALVIAGLVAWLCVAPVLAARIPPAAFVLPTALLLWTSLSLRPVSPEAVTNAFDAQRHYKKILHRGIWSSGVAWAVVFVLLSLTDGARL